MINHFRIKLSAVFVIAVVLCAAGLPAQRVQAEVKPVQNGMENVQAEARPVQSASDRDLAVPAVTKLKNTAGGVRITWTKIDGADYYRIYRKSGDRDLKDWTMITETKDLEFLDTKVKGRSGSKVSYKVKAATLEGDSAISRVKSIIRLEKPAKSDFRIKNVKKGIRISYPIGSDAAEEGMIVYRKASGESSFTRIAKVKGGDYTDLDAEEGKTYSYRICTYLSGYKSAMSSVKTVTRA